jgi:hypothetical protein
MGTACAMVGYWGDMSLKEGQRMRLLVDLQSHLLACEAMVQCRPRSDRSMCMAFPAGSHR